MSRLVWHQGKLGAMRETGGMGQVAQDGMSCASLGGSTTDLMCVISPSWVVNAKIAVGWPFLTIMSPAWPRARIGREVVAGPPALARRA